MHGQECPTHCNAASKSATNELHEIDKLNYEVMIHGKKFRETYFLYLKVHHTISLYGIHYYD